MIEHYRTTTALPLVLAIAAVLVAAMLLQLTAFAGLATLGDDPSLPLSSLAPHAVEWLALIAVTLWCIARPRPAWRFILATVLLLFTTFQATQFLAFYFTQQFLTRDAFQNAQHVGLLVSPFTIAIALVPVALTTVAALVAARAARLALPRRTRAALTGAVAVLALTVLAAVPPREAPPVTALARLLVIKPEPLWLELTDSELATVRSYGFSIDPDSPYPFIKPRIYDAPHPFPRRGDRSPPNVIVFFVESLSARKLSIYGSPYPGITPAIEDFARGAMVVDNYFSHTAATYRGLRGQLCSMYPFYGGVGAWFDPGFEPPATRLLGLPHLARQAGYDTVLLGANAREKARMHVQAEAVGFERSMLRDQILAELLGSGPVPGRHHLSDHQMMRALDALLDSDHLGRPFFLFVYNVGTHTNLDAGSDGAPYGDGAQNVLNTTHAFDDAFGRFWSSFQHSPLAADTVVVLTADHAHFPTPAFIEVAGPGYRKVFFDRIPLVIRHPHLELPPRFDPGVRTSLDFAPTMAHLLDLPNQPNPFLGRSIFDPPVASHPTGLGFYSETLCLIRSDGRMRVYSTTGKLPPEAATMARFVKLIQHAELKDRLWDEGG